MLGKLTVRQFEHGPFDSPLGSVPFSPTLTPLIPLDDAQRIAIKLDAGAG